MRSCNRAVAEPDSPGDCTGAQLRDRGVLGESLPLSAPAAGDRQRSSVIGADEDSPAMGALGRGGGCDPPAPVLRSAGSRGDDCMSWRKARRSFGVSIAFDSALIPLS